MIDRDADRIAECERLLAFADLRATQLAHRVCEPPEPSLFPTPRYSGEMSDVAARYIELYERLQDAFGGTMPASLAERAAAGYWNVLQFALREYLRSDPGHFWPGLSRLAEDMASVAAEGRDPFARRLRSLCAGEKRLLEETFRWFGEARRPDVSEALSGLLASL